MNQQSKDHSATLKENFGHASNSRKTPISRLYGWPMGVFREVPRENWLQGIIHALYWQMCVSVIRGWSTFPESDELTTGLMLSILKNETFSLMSTICLPKVVSLYYKTRLETSPVSKFLLSNIMLCTNVKLLPKVFSLYYKAQIETPFVSKSVFGNIMLHSNVNWRILASQNHVAHCWMTSLWNNRVW